MRPNDIGLFHKQQILSILRRKRHSRADIARMLNLKKSSISLIIEKLISQGFILEAKKNDNIVKNGRKPIPLKLNPEKGYIIGIEIGFEGILSVLTNFQGKICAKEKVPPKSFRYNADELIGEILKLFSEFAKRKNNILGIGIGMSGRINEENGVIKFSNLLEEKNVPLKEMLEEETAVPVFIDSNDNVGGLCEKHFGRGINAKNMVYLQKRRSLGAAIFIDGKLYRGMKNYAGELTFYVENLYDKNHSRNIYGSTLDLKKYFLLELKDKEHPLIKEKCGREEYLTEQMIFEAAREKDDFALNIVNNYAEHYGILAAHLADFLAPDSIVFGGDFVWGGNLFIETAERAFREKALKEISNKIKLELSPFDDDAVALGGTVLAFTQLCKKTNLLNNFMENRVVEV
ncbi:MAG: ROK family transcriptional regulator [Victivallales bacterium]